MILQDDKIVTMSFNDSHVTPINEADDDSFEGIDNYFGWVFSIYYFYMSRN